jgi:tetratricopeptide (TPR) repeat protein
MNTKVYKNILTFLISTALSFLMAEIIIQLFLGFRHRPFIETQEDNVRIISSNPNCWDMRSDLNFEMPKPANNYRIFAFGGSTMEGGLYPEYKVNIMRFLDLFLEDTYPSMKTEIINLGKSGENSSDVVKKVKLALSYSPDLFIIYTGHNEFLHLIDPYLRKTKLQALLMKSILFSKVYSKVIDCIPELKSKKFEEERYFIDEPVSNKRTFHKIQIRYGENLEKIVQMCKRHNIRLIIVAPAGNYVEWQPNRSIRWKKLNNDETTKWEKFYYESKKSMENSEWPKALASLAECYNMDSSFAQIEHDRGKVLMRLGRYAEAKIAFQNARDFDGAPKIASTALINKIVEICNNYDMPFIDANHIFESHSTYNMNDSKFFVDAHHPSWQGDFLIAKALFNMIVENSMISHNKIPEQITTDDIEYLQRLNLSRQDSVDFYIGRANWYMKAYGLRWEGEKRLSFAKGYINDALFLVPNDTKALISYGIWACLSNEPEVAKQKLFAAKSFNKGLYKQIIRSPWAEYILTKNRILDQN